MAQLAPNAARRLKQVLDAFEDSRVQIEVVHSVSDIWTHALGVGTVEDARRHLARAASLVDEIAAATVSYAEESGDSGAIEVVGLHQDEWLRALILPVKGTEQQHNGSVFISEPARAALGLLSTTLANTFPRLALLDEQAHSDIRADVRILRDEVLKDTEPDEKLRRLVIERLHQIEQALDYYAIDGSDGVLRACTLLAGSAAFTGSKKPNIFVRVDQVATGIAVRMITYGGFTGSLVTMAEAYQKLLAP